MYFSNSPVGGYGSDHLISILVLVTEYTVTSRTDFGAKIVMNVNFSVPVLDKAKYNYGFSNKWR